MESRLYRSRNSKILGGVAGGLGDYFNVDPTLIRLAFVLITPLWGASVAAYLILWIITPLEPLVVGEMNNDENVYRPDLARRKRNNSGSKSILGYILIFIGVIAFLHNFIPSFDFGDFFPLLLIIAGVYILFANFNKRDNSDEAEL